MAANLSRSAPAQGRTSSWGQAIGRATTPGRRGPCLVPEWNPGQDPKGAAPAPLSTHPGRLAQTRRAAGSPGSALASDPKSLARRYNAAPWEWDDPDLWTSAKGLVYSPLLPVHKSLPAELNLSPGLQREASPLLPDTAHLLVLRLTPGQAGSGFQSREELSSRWYPGGPTRGRPCCPSALPQGPPSTLQCRGWKGKSTRT